MASKNTDQTRVIAAIDIGTNSFHLIVCDVNIVSGRFRILDRAKEIVRLGSSSSDMKHLSASSINRGVQTLKRFKRIAASFHASIRAVATSAVREAVNKSEFIKRVKIETGISIKVASGFEEARLIHLGVLQALPVFNKKLLLIDIGGGSTEFLIGYKRNIRYGNSLKIGAVRLTRRFLKSKKITPKEIKECRKFVKGMLAPVVREIEKYPYEIALGSSGTILSLAQIIRTSQGFDSQSSLNGFTFSRKELRQALENIFSCRSIDDLSEIPGIDQARTDIIVAGAIIIEQIFSELGIEAMKVSEFALREGIIFDSIEKSNSNGKIHGLNDVQNNSIIHLGRHYRFDESHSRHVAKLALSIFDQTQGLHGLGEIERNYLETAALLHEIGAFISHAQHHIHSYYLIRNSDIIGYLENEKEIIANIARYHRKSHPKIKHDGFRDLSADDQYIVTVLSSILRIADGLDRTHSSAVESIVAKNTGRSVLLKVYPRKKTLPVDLEVWGAELKKSLFEDTFDTSVRLKVASN